VELDKAYARRREPDWRALAGKLAGVLRVAVDDHAVAQEVRDQADDLITDYHLAIAEAADLRFKIRALIGKENDELDALAGAPRRAETEG